MKNKLMVMTALLISELVSAQSNFGVGLEYSSRNHKTEETKTRLMPRLSLGYDLKFSESFTIDSNVIVTSDSARASFNYVLGIQDSLKTHVGLNVGNGLRVGMQAGVLLQDRYLIEYVRVNSDFNVNTNSKLAEKPDWISNTIAVGLKFGF